jgi:acyl-CoA synthetase (AMP-forming)/AMP-acid ligase II
MGHIYDLASLSAWSGLFLKGSKVRTPRALDALRTWGTSIAGLTVVASRWVPNEVMLVDDLGPLTWREVNDRTSRLAAGLPLSGPHPRVGLLCRNHRWMVESLIACSKRGAETVLLNTGFGAGQLRSVLDELRVDVLIADAEFATLLDAVPQGLRRRVIWVEDTLGRAGVPTVEQIIQATPSQELTPPGVQGRTVMMSSGTTGRPKGARRPPKPGLWPLASIRSRIPFRARDTMIIEAPLFHTWGFAAMQICLAMRGTMVLHRRFEPEATLRAVQEHPRTVLMAVPVMLQRIMELPAEVIGAYDSRSLRIAAVSGSPLPGDLATRFMDAFGDRLYNVYGSTEASWVAIATPRELRQDPGTAGRPPRNTSLVILDEDGSPLPRGEVGRIFAANEMLFEGYTGGEPVEVWEGLLSTGDLGHIDDRGLLRVDGRADGVVVCGGENVVARDVEDLLARMPGVREAAVVGVPDKDWGNRLAAYIVLSPGARLDADAVRNHVRVQVARFAVPRDVHFIPELPRNATGKVLHVRLSAVRRSDGQLAG